MGVTDDDGYINVDWTMRVMGHERIYAVGDCVSFAGPKMGHMAVRQAEVAATNLAAEIDGHEPLSHYDHELGQTRAEKALGNIAFMSLFGERLDGIMKVATKR